MGFPELSIVFTILEQRIFPNQVAALIEEIANNLVEQDQQKIIDKVCAYGNYDLLQKIMVIFRMKRSVGRRKVVLRRIVEYRRTDLFDRFFEDNQEMFTTCFCTEILPQCCRQGAVEMVEKIFHRYQDYFLSLENGFTEELLDSTSCPYDGLGEGVFWRLDVLRKLIEIYAGKDLRKGIKKVFLHTNQEIGHPIFDFLVTNYREMLEEDEEIKQVLAKVLAMKMRDG